MPKQNIKPYRKYYFLLYFLVFLNIYILKGHGQSLLWRISSEDLKSSSYLYGTIHVKDKRAFEFNDSVLSAFEKCNATALEVDLSAENIVQVAQKMILPDGLTLDSLFTPEEYQIIKSVVEEATGMDISLFNRLKPISLLSLVLNFKFANDMDVSVDEYFYKKAKEHDKQVIGIETIDEQLEVLENIPTEFVVEFFKNIEQAEEDFEQIIILYRSAELGKLLKLMQKDKAMVMLQEDLLVNRNIKMTARISKLIHEQSTFIAVGAGHLPGKKGIISLLTEAGYNLEPVK